MTSTLVAAAHLGFFRRNYIPSIGWACPSVPSKSYGSPGCTPKALRDAIGIVIYIPQDIKTMTQAVNVVVGAVDRVKQSKDAA